jgi:hypothetical protein
VRRRVGGAGDGSGRATGAGGEGGFWVPTTHEARRLDFFRSFWVQNYGLVPRPQVHVRNAHTKKILFRLTKRLKKEGYVDHFKSSEANAMFNKLEKYFIF